VSKSHFVWILHRACRNHTLHLETALCVYKSHSCVLKYALRSEIKLVRVPSHYACEHNTCGCRNLDCGLKIGCNLIGAFFFKFLGSSALPKPKNRQNGSAPAFALELMIMMFFSILTILRKFKIPVNRQQNDG
jgi:hypothetical protein